MALQGLTALVLAGTRPGGDPLAQYAGVSHKAMIDIGGLPMLQRVLLALAGVPAIARIVVAIDRPELVAALPACGKPVTVLPAQSGPSASVAHSLAALGAPLLLTTADHALLQSSWVEELLIADDGRHDVLVALARRESVLAAVPQTERTWLRFADGDYSGCNLFLLRTTAAQVWLRCGSSWKPIASDLCPCSSDWDLPMRCATAVAGCAWIRRCCVWGSCRAHASCRWS
jgi:GTP:adenosylcobinamide-phosphate guanylyltransferase